MDTTQKIFVFCCLLQGVWCGNWNISVPDKIEALIGSCVIINCRFDILSTYDADLTDTASGMWYKNGTQNVMFDSRNANSIFEGNIVGKLKAKNCTTIFYNVTLNHNDTFTFRLEGNNGLKLTFRQDHATIHVINSPPKPTVQMFKDQVEVQGEVLEGSSVSLRCSSQTLCSSSPPTLTWSSTDSLSLNGNSSRLQDNPENQTEIISDLNFTVTRLHHRVTFFCNINYQLQTRNTTAQNNITLRVLYAPKNTSVSVSPSDSVMEGSSVNLTCSSDANPAVLNYTWYRENEGQLDQLQTGQNLTFSVTDRTQTGRYYCQATNQHGTQNTSVFLNIQHAPKNTSVSVFPSDSILEGRSTILTCSSDANPAVLNYTWYRENEGQLDQLQTGQNLTFSVTDRTQTGRYYCQATNQHGTQNTSVFLNIQYPPKMFFSSSSSCAGMLVYWCEFHGNPSPIVEWRLSGRPVINSTNTFISEERLNSSVLRSFITLHQSLTHTDTLQCVAINSHGTDSQQIQLLQSLINTTDCQWILIPLLIILSLILLLFALTVGLALYRIRQLTTKLQVQNEAGTYASLQLSAANSDYETLNVKKSGK